MSEVTMKVLYLGYLDCQYLRIVDGYEENVMYKSPVSAILIRHPELGNILYDTGNSPFHRTAYGEHINSVYPVGEFISIEDALEAEGLACKDIDILILSHLHFDHCGGLRYFKGSKAAQNIIVSKADLENACCEIFGGNRTSAYIKSLFDMDGVSFRLLDEDVELGRGIRLFIQKAHTPGVIGMVLDTMSAGTVITTGDAVYTRESWETRVPPGGGINKSIEAFQSNIERLDKLRQKYGATMLFGHDSKQIAEWSSREQL